MSGFYWFLKFFLAAVILFMFSWLINQGVGDLLDEVKIKNKLARGVVTFIAFILAYLVILALVVCERYVD